MHIGIDIRVLMEKQYSGIPEYCFNVLDNMLSLDEYNTYTLFINSFKNSFYPKWGRDRVNIFFSRLPNKIFNLSSFLHLGKEIDYKLQKKYGKIDLFWLPNLNYINFSKDARYIVTVHDLSFEHHQEFYSFKQKIWHKGLHTSYLLRNAFHIITVSENTKNDICIYYGIPEYKITVIPLGINSVSNISKQQKLKIIKKYNLPKKFIMSLATLEPRKNTLSVIEAFNILKKEEKYKDLSLVLVGKKTKNYKELDKYIANSVFKDQIYYLGYVSNFDKYIIYSLADVFVYPSFYEGFGLPPLEAMSMGTPVITADNSSMAEIFGESALLIDAYNVKDIVKAIALLLLDEKLKKFFIEQGLKLSSEYTWQKTAQKTLNLFYNLYTNL